LKISLPPAILLRASYKLFTNLVSALGGSAVRPPPPSPSPVRFSGSIVGITFLLAGVVHQVVPYLDQARVSPRTACPWRRTWLPADRSRVCRWFLAVVVSFQECWARTHWLASPPSVSYCLRFCVPLGSLWLLRLVSAFVSFPARIAPRACSGRLRSLASPLAFALRTIFTGLCLQTILEGKSL